MRNLFIVLAKVVGLLQIPTAIGYSEILIRYIFFFGSGKGFLADFGDTYVSIAGVCLANVLFLGFTWLLLFRTNWIADRLCLSGGELTFPVPDSFLRIGIKLLGIYVLVESVPSFIWAMMEPGAFNPDTSASHFWIRIVPSALKFVFGLILVGKTKYVIELISGDSKQKEEPSA